MTGKLLAYHPKSPRVPLVVRVPQFENDCVRAFRFDVHDNFYRGIQHIYQRSVGKVLLASAHL